jgi:hypothetical protein
MYKVLEKGPQRAADLMVTEAKQRIKILKSLTSNESKFLGLYY